MAEETMKDAIADDIKSYVNMRVDQAKLSAVEGLSSITGSAIGFIICLFLVNLSLMLFSVVFVYLIDLLINSWVWSVVILAFIYLIVGILVLRKPGAFRNMMVRVFAPMFFCPKIDEDDE